MNQGLFSHLSCSFGNRSVVIFKQLSKECISERKTMNRINFLHQCIGFNILPRSLWFKLPGRYIFDIGFRKYIGRRLLHKEIGSLTHGLHVTRNNIRCRRLCLGKIINDNTLLLKKTDLFIIRYNGVKFLLSNETFMRYNG